MHLARVVTIRVVTISLATLFAFNTGALGLGQFSGVSTKGNLSVWRVNHGNGAVALCSFEGYKNEPVCYPWSSGGAAGSYEIIGGDDVLSSWRINASTGAVSLCEYKELTDPPACTPWSTQ